MITAKQKEKLDEIKPRGYRKKVREYLLENGHDYETETIKQVYLGNRSNNVILKGIVDVFLGHNNDLETNIAEINKRLGIE